ncbi:MAG: hypothetical protein ABIO70_03285 [Pseudomonadota bacterium]
MPLHQRDPRLRGALRGVLGTATLFLAVCAAGLGAFELMGWTPDIPAPRPTGFVAAPCGPDAVPQPLQAAFGDDAFQKLQTLVAQNAMAETVALDPISGATPAPVTLGPDAPQAALPPVLVQRLCAAARVPDAPALGERLVERAEQGLRDPDGELSAHPWLRGHLRAAVLQGATDELQGFAGPLAAAPPLGRRPLVVVRGQSRQVSAMVIGHDHAAEREAATFDAWAELVREALGAQRFDLGLRHGRHMVQRDPLTGATRDDPEWVEGWFDWEAWFEAMEQGRPAEDLPFYAQGRLLALSILNQAGLVEIVFLGHGIEVDPKAAADGRYQPFALGPVQAGDEHQEVLNLRAERRGFTLRYGLTLDARAPFWAASCSNRQGGETRPEQSTAAIAFLLANGWYPDATSLEPFVFGLYKQLQAGLLEAADAPAAGAVVRATALEQRARFEAPGDLRAILPLGDGLYLLRAGCSETPDLLLITDPAWRPDADDALRLALATSAWRHLVPIPASHAFETGNVWDPCADPGDCRDTLDELLPQARQVVANGPPPADRGARYRVGGLLRARWARPEPDASQRFLRLALVPTPSQAEPARFATLLAIEDTLRAAFAAVRARVRLQGWVEPPVGLE